VSQFRNYELALGFLIATVVWTGVLAWQSKQPPSNNYGRPAVAESQVREGGQAIADPSAEKNHREGQQKGNWYDTFFEHLAEWLIAVFNGLLVYVTYRLVTTTGDLRASTDRLWNAGERQIAVADKAATAATLSAQEAVRMRENLERQLRAYVVKTLGEVRNLREGEAPQAHVVIENTGQTPAYDVRAWIGAALGRFPPAEPPPPFPSRPEASIASIGAGKELHLTVFLSGPLTQQNLAGLIDGSLAIHVIGRAEYRDAFGERQHTLFNTFYGGRYGANENGVLVNAPDGNEAT